MAQERGHECTGPLSFYVDGTAGPLLPQEVERAWRWGASLASQSAVASA